VVLLKLKQADYTYGVYMKNYWPSSVIIAVLPFLFLIACASAPQRNPLPEDLKDIAQIPYIPEARFWGDQMPPHLLDALEEEKYQIQLRDPESKNNPINYLALSGGGGNGAFGAGLLVGWTEAGNRPEFRAVAGISTGALAAPFAFLGSNYDGALKDLYTTTSTKEILKKRSWLSIINADAFTHTEPLRKIIADTIDGRVLEQIAIEHSRGRRLFIGTTNLDAERPVIWNIGAIAASGKPNALEVVRNVMLASAAIPGVFPPVYFKVKANDQTFDEIHVDGGAASQVFLYPVTLDLQWMEKQIGLEGEDHIYVIRNSRLEPEWQSVAPRVLPIVKRSIETLVRTQGIGDLYRIYLGAQRDKMDYNLAYIPSDFHEKPKEEFDPEYMKKLFDLGYSLSRNGYPWAKSPPGFEPPTHKNEKERSKKK
jgi:predicted acylesterase/phospholipase RssA